MTGLNFVKFPAKAAIVANILNVSLGQAELGEMYYCLTNNRIYIRIQSGWKYVSAT